MDPYRSAFSSRQQQELANSLSVSPIQLYRGTSPPSPTQLSPLARRHLLLSSVMTPMDRSASSRGNYSFFTNPTSEGSSLLMPRTGSPNSRSSSSSSNNNNNSRLNLAVRPEQGPSGSAYYSSPASTGARAGPRRVRLPSAATSHELRKRKTFLVFIKVLLKVLRKSPDQTLHNRAKAIISHVTRRNRNKEPQYCPLPEALEQQLRPVVGEAQWKRANACLDLYLEKRRRVHIQERVRGMQLAQQQQQYPYSQWQQVQHAV